MLKRGSQALRSVYKGIARARQQGANDKEIRDTALIAAACCMYNCYVDGLATGPTDLEMYRQNGRRLPEEGYIQSIVHLSATKERA